LGPHLEGGYPDLRNLNFFSVSCSEGNLIFLVSDGVHDNLDPYHLGVSSKDLNLKEDWSHLPLEQIEKVKSQYMLNVLEQKLNGIYDPQNVVNKLLDYSMNITEVGRKWMEENNGKKLPPDYLKYPGKMDHATVVCLKVGRNQLFQKNGSNDNLHRSWKKNSVSIESPNKILNPLIGRERPTSPASNEINIQHVSL